MKKNAKAKPVRLLSGILLAVILVSSQPLNAMGAVVPNGEVPPPSIMESTLGDEIPGVVVPPLPESQNIPLGAESSTTESTDWIELLSADDAARGGIYSMPDRELVENATSLIHDQAVLDWIANERSKRDLTDEEMVAVAYVVKRVYEAEQLSSSADNSDPLGSSGFSTLSPGGGSGDDPAYSKGVGVYPTQKGKILATADSAHVSSVAFPTGHAAIVIDERSVWTSFPKSASPGEQNGTAIEGVQREFNNWDNAVKHSTCFGLDVIATNSAQEEQAADWCAKQFGKPYNFNFFDTGTRGSFYCSQLVWAAYKDNFGIDLNTSEWAYGILNPIHPMEFVHSSYTTLVYRQGATELGWNQVNGSWYYIDNNGNPLKGRYTIDGTNYFFGASGEMAIQHRSVCLQSRVNASKTIDVYGGYTKVAGLQMQVWDLNKGINQRFVVWTANGTDWYIQCEASGMVLDIKGGSITKGAAIIQWPIHGGVNQRWRLTKYTDGTTAFRSAANTNYCIDITGSSMVNGTKLILWSYSGTTNQRFYAG